jgi:lipopolysaccharide/colanic/teichoic acid biosynthesis glycosyltransferase
MGYRGKRLLDLVVVLLLAPLWVPLLAVAAGMVRATLGAPALFRQRRPGLHGRSFELLKLRTMTDARAGDGRLLADAARMTRVGRWLRASSLDELPELINVLRGDMSLVGPRPLLPEYLPLYSLRHARRHELRPGLTGLAQVSGRNSLTWPERFELDVEYVDSCSLRLDLHILGATIRAVLDRRGISAPGMETMSRFTGYDPK